MDTVARFRTSKGKAKVYRGQLKDNLEIEFRFNLVERSKERGATKTKLVREDRRNPGNDISKLRFQRVFDFLKSRYKPVITKIVDYNYKTGDITSKIRHQIIDGKESWQKKQTLDIQYLTDLSGRLTLSYEKDIKPQLFYDKSSALIRDKMRYSFQVSPALKVDMTKVVVDTKTDYEIEIEVTKYSDTVMDSLYKLILFVYNLINGDTFYTSYTTRIDIVDKLFRVLQGYLTNRDRVRFTDYIPNFKLPQVLPFKWDDFSVETFHPDRKLTVTWKTDGEHAFLISYKYLNKVRLYLYTMGSKKLIKVADLDSVMDGLIIEGEFVERDEGVREFYVFDCLQARPVQDMAEQIIDQEHTERLVFADKLVQRLKGFKLDIDIFMKTFYALYPADELTDKVDYDKLRTFVFSRMKEVFAKQPKSYKNDGLIFTPGKSPYRKLIEDRSILKWKPLEQLTIDLLVSHSSKTLMDSSGRVIDLPTDFEELKDDDGQVVEFNYIDGKLNKIRVRDDKTRGNGPIVVDQTLKLIRDPITAEVLSGESMRIYRKYHNNIKRRLFTSYKGNSLFDIGSGKGGDLSKMERFKTKYLLEPNTEYIKELERRMTHMKIKDVKILNMKAEDTDDVKDYFTDTFDHRVDVISSMLSLSFFYLDEDKLDGLVNTIDFMGKESFYFIYLTIDKDYLLEVLNGKTSLNQNGLLAELFINDEDTSEFKHRLKISLLGSKTLEGQVEGLVDMQILKDKLGEKGWSIKVVEDERADKQPIMSGFEYLFSQAYRYGCWLVSKEMEKSIGSDDLLKPFLFVDGLQLSCIADKYSLLHCVLKAVMVEYQENGSQVYRDNAVKSLHKTLIKFAKTEFDYSWEEIHLAENWHHIAQVMFKFFNIFIFIIDTTGKVIFKPKSASDYNILIIKNKSIYSLLVQEKIDYRMSIFDREHEFVDYFYQ